VIKATTQPLYSRERDKLQVLQEPGWASEQLWTGWGKSRPPPGFESRNV